MVKCPFCGFDNEDGALFCEQCKSDLSSVAPAPAPPPPPPAPEPIPFAPIEESVPMAAVVEAMPEEIPVASFEPAPMAAIIEEAEPVAEPVAEAKGMPEPPPAPPVVEVPAPIPAPLPAMAPPLDPGPPPAPVIEAPVPAPAPIPTPAPAPAPAPAASNAKAIPAGSEPKLIVIRGQRINIEFPIYGGQNFIGRADDKPVDIDLEDQEPPERVWTSRQHAVLDWDDSTGTLVLEDLNSSNGTYVNRVRVHPGQPQQLYLGDVIQIGNIHMRVKV